MNDQQLRQRAREIAAVLAKVTNQGRQVQELAAKVKQHTSKN